RARNLYYDSIGVVSDNPPMYQRLGPQWLDQIDRQRQAMSAKRQMLRPDAERNGTAHPAALQRYQRTGFKLHRPALVHQPPRQKIHRRRTDKSGDVGVGRMFEHV